MSAPTTKSMDEIVALCRRRGFIWQSSEIYNGINGFWDYGPLGARLKRNLKEAWWNDIVERPPDGPDGKPVSIVPVDCTIIMNPKVWEASGHVAGFNDPMVDDMETQQRFRADHLIGVWVFPMNAPAADEVPTDVDFAQTQASAPEMTIVAANPSEAVQLLANKWPKILKGLSPLGSEEYLAHNYTAINFVPPDEGMNASSYQRCVLKRVGADRIAQSPQDVPSPFTGEKGKLTKPRMFNLMYDVFNGPIRNEDNRTYLRPETAQGIFTQFWNVVDTSRVKVPFGIAQMGKAFRNEVTPRNFTFRSREFEQMEIEFFIRPDEADPWYRYWRDSRFAWWQSIGLAGDNLLLREHEKGELAHYAKAGEGVCDVEYRFPFTAPGFGELEGIAHRTDYDLRQHAEHSGYGDKLRYFDQERNQRYFPHVIEPSAGADRGTLAVICEAYTPDEARPSKVYLKFTPRLAPIKAAIFPLVKKDGMPQVAENLYRNIRSKFACQLDVKQSIGKRYARMDEAGTPYCFTIDGQTLEDQTVTVRDRDTQDQKRIAIDKVETFLLEHIG